MASIVIGLFGYVSIVCRVDAVDLFCNSASGYYLIEVAPTGGRVILEASDGPQRKPHGYVLRDGYSLVIEPRL